MWPWLKGLFLDETKFVGLLRLLLMGFGGAVLSDDVAILDAVPNWLAVPSMAAAGFIRSSTKQT